MSILLRRAMMMASSLVKHIISSVTGLVTFTTNVAADMPSVLCEFAPVQTGSGDPSPSNVRPISGWTGLTVTRTGKNLLALPIIPYKNINPYGGNSSFNPSDYMWMKAGTYTLSYIANETNRWCIKIFDKDGNALSDSAHQITNGYFNTSYKGWIRAANAAAGATSQTFTLVEDCYLRICRTFTYPGTVDTVEFTDCQLEFGGMATAYEPYNGISYSATIPTSPGTVYHGTLDIITGELVIDRLGVVANGTTNEYITGYLEGSDGNASWLNVRLTMPGSTVYPHFVTVGNTNTGRAMCSFLKYQYANANTTPHYYKSGNLNLFVSKTDYPTVDSFKTWLASNPQMFVLPINPAITYQLTPQQIQSIIGTNNVWHDANGGITVEYYNKY